MKRLIFVMICVFLYVMPIHATQLSEENMDEAAVVEEVSENVDESVKENAEEVEESVQEERVSQPETEEAEEVEEAEEEEEVAEITTEQSSEEEILTDAIIEETIEETTEELIEEFVEVTIPDVIGMDIAKAMEVLGAIELPDGTRVEVIKEYIYSNEAETDIVFKQSPIGSVSKEEAGKVYITVSMGRDPYETVVTGIDDPLNQKIKSQYGVNWGSLPEYYEYNWDNSMNCWVYGVWIDGVKYLTPEGTFNTNVRHLIQLYTDDKYVYTHIVFSRDYGNSANGSWFQYFVDGKMTAFQIETFEGKQLANNNLSPGSYKVAVRHANGGNASGEVPGADAYYTVFDSQLNPHLEIRIPLSEMARQNPDISLDTIGTIGFFTPNLMMQGHVITIAGAGTAPLATAAVTLVVIPTTAVILKKKRKKVKKEINV